MFNNLRIGDKAKRAVSFTPTHPDPAIGRKHGITLSLHGKHSEQYRNAIADMLRRTKKNKDLSTDEAVEESAKLIASCAAGWEGVTGDDGKAKKFNQAELLEILKDDDFRWLRLQCEAFMAADDNFF